MAIKGRCDIKNKLLTRLRPKQQDFHDLLESFYNKLDDPIKLSGWQFRSFFKDLRAEDLPITAGGSSIIEIPATAARLNKIRIFGTATPAQGAPGGAFTIATSLAYFSDKLIPSLNGVPSTGNPLPTSFFAHFILGYGSNPSADFKIDTAGPQFDSTFDFASGVFMDFAQARFIFLTIEIIHGSFPDPNIDASYLYYGFEFE